jgi:hypothetical protein
MLIQRGQRLFGADSFLLRNAASGVLHHPVRHSGDKPVFTLESFARRIGMPLSECSPVLQRMVEKGWLSQEGKDFVAEKPFIQLGAARIGKRQLSRAKAEQLLEKVVAEARELNREENSDCDHIVEIAVFGSFLDDTKMHLGDLDIGYSTRRRKGFARRPWTGWSDFWGKDPERNALKRLKGRSPFVSLHEMKELIDLKMPYRIVYRLSDDLPEIYGSLSN